MSVGSEPAAPDERLTGVVRNLIALRKLRSQIFPSAMFGEPAWDILLALYLASDGVDGTAETLSKSSATPLSTTIRWLNYLDSEGLIERERGVGGLRKDQILLSEAAKFHLDRFLQQMIRSDQLIR